MAEDLPDKRLGILSTDALLPHRHPLGPDPTLPPPRSIWLAKVLHSFEPRISPTYLQRAGTDPRTLPHPLSVSRRRCGSAALTTRPREPITTFFGISISNGRIENLSQSPFRVFASSCRPIVLQSRTALGLQSTFPSFMIHSTRMMQGVQNAARAHKITIATGLEEERSRRGGVAVRPPGGARARSKDLQCSFHSPILS